jgi:hypothetical protein
MIVTGTVACSTRATLAPPPSEVETVEFLDHIVDLARAGDFDALCAVGGGNCRRALGDAGADAVPDAAPTILGTWLLGDTPAGGGYSVGGRILEVCGVDGRGRTFRTQMLIFSESGQLKAIEPVYWSGIRIATDPNVGPDPSVAATCPVE